MEEIPISKFKANCPEILERVRKTRRPIRVTRYGKPVVEIVPPSERTRKRPWIGSLCHTGMIKGDIIRPASEEQDWEVYRA